MDLSLNMTKHRKLMQKLSVAILQGSTMIHFKQILLNDRLLQMFLDSTKTKNSKFLFFNLSNFQSVKIAPYLRGIIKFIQASDFKVLAFSKLIITQKGMLRIFTGANNLDVISFIRCEFKVLPGFSFSGALDNSKFTKLIFENASDLSEKEELLK
jgi:hypothetical protein